MSDGAPQSFEPWRNYDSEDEEKILAKLQKKTSAIRETTDYDLIEDATAIAASVLNHEQAKQGRQTVIDLAHELHEAGMTAN